MTDNIKRILVVALGNNKLFFCGVDQERIVFFDDLLLGSLVGMTEKDTCISVRRNGAVVDTKTLMLSGGHMQKIFVTDFDVTKGNNADFNVEQKQDVKKLHAFSFQKNDILEINKEWKDFEQPEAWLSQISTYRSYGADFIDVFVTNHTLLAPIMDFFELNFEKMVSMSKKIIFTSCPEDPNLNKFY